MSLQTIQLAFCQRTVTVLSHADNPKHCCSGTPTRCSADRKLGQTEGQIPGVGGVDEVHVTLENFVTSAFICDSVVHVFIPLKAVSTVSRSTNCNSLNVNNFPVAIDQAPSRDSAVQKKNAKRSVICKRSLKRRFCQTLLKSSMKDSNPMFCTTQSWLRTE